MNSSKVLIVPLSVILGLLLFGTWAATQSIASLYNYHEALGDPFITVGSLPIYLPWRFFQWWVMFGDAPDVAQDFDAKATWIYGSAFIGVIYAVIASILRAKNKTELSSHGTARWATLEEIHDSDLTNGEGIILGMAPDGTYLRDNGSTHTLVVAPTRSGKGVSIIVPTLLTWPHSILVTDIKRENWAVTSTYRQKYLNNLVIKFDPTSDDGTSARFNPLDSIRLKTNSEVRDAQNLADILVDPEGTGQMDHWAKTGHALMVGIALHLRYLNPKATLTDMAAFLSDPEKDFETILTEMKSTIHDSGDTFQRIYGKNTSTHPIVAMAAQELLNKSPNELSGVLSTAMSFLGLYRDPIIARNTSASDFEVEDLMNHEKPVSLYLLFPPSDINRMTPLIRMILNQIIRRLTEKMEFDEKGQSKKGYKHRLALMLDEFPALGKLEPLEKALAFIAGYGLKAILITQDISQLNKTYTKDNSIVGNCHIRAMYTPNELSTAKYISESLGNRTELVENRSYTGHRLNVWLRNVTVSENQIQRPLLTPDEVRRMDEKNKIIFIAGKYPMLVNKIKYYEDSNFKCRVFEAVKKSDVTRYPDSNLSDTQPLPLTTENFSSISRTADTSDDEVYYADLDLHHEEEAMN